MSKIFVVSSPPGGHGFGFAQLKRSAGTHFPTAHLTLLFVPHSRGALWKECSKPGGDAKSPWTARSIPQSPLSSRISPCASPASLLLHRKILFAQNLGIVPTTDSFTHPLPMLHKPTSSLFLRTLPQRVLAGLAHMDFARAKPRHHCRTPYANQFVQCLSLLLRRTTAQTAQLLAVTPLASNKQGY